MRTRDYEVRLVNVKKDTYIHAFIHIYMRIVDDQLVV